eukprot:3442862-Amphidinium_carterae.4
MAHGRIRFKTQTVQDPWVEVTERHWECCDVVSQTSSGLLVPDCFPKNCFFFLGSHGQGPGEDGSWRCLLRPHSHNARFIATPEGARQPMVRWHGAHERTAGQRNGRAISATRTNEKMCSKSV